MDSSRALILAFLWALLCGYLATRKGRSFFGYFFLSFCITPLITMIIIACLRSLKEGETPETISTEPESSYNSIDEPTTACINAPAQERSITVAEEDFPRTKPNVQFCMHCGEKLKPGYKFCGYCGKKIEVMPDDL